MTYAHFAPRGTIALLSGKRKQFVSNQGGVHMNGINKLFDELKKDYMMYVHIAYADQLR